MVSVIRGAGGVSVMAHPLKYKMTRTKLRLFLQDFSEAGGQGLEVISGNQTSQETKDMITLAQKYGLYASVGSDFHRPNCPWQALGYKLSIPESVPAVWNIW